MKQGLFIFLKFLFLATINALFAQDIPDGIWNDKPWDKEKLEQQAKEGNPTAMAEWAYCASHSELSLPFDHARIFDYATRSEAKGSLLGKLQLGEALFKGHGTAPDRERGYQLVKEAAEAGHPAAMLELAIYQMVNPYKDHEKALTLWKKIQKHPSRYRDFGEFLLNDTGAQGFIDREDAFAALIRSFKQTRDIRAASSIYYEAHSDRDTSSFITSELLEEATIRLQEGSDLGNGLCHYRLGMRAIKEVNPNLGIPLLLQSANNGDYRAAYSLAFWCHNPKNSPKFGGYTITGSTTSASNAATYLYQNNFYRDNNFIARSHAEHLSSKKFKDKTPRTLDDEAVQVYRNIIKDNRSDYRAWSALSHYIAAADFNKKKPQKEATEHARNIFIYRSQDHRTMAHWLSWQYTIHRNPERRDYVKGYASLLYATSRNINDFLVEEKKWLRRAKRELTPEQLEEAERLVADGFPYARKHREAAFNYLKKVGDIPQDWTFDDDLEHEGEKEQASAPAPARAGFSPLFALMAQAPLLAVGELENPIQLLSKLANKENFEPEELPRLAKLLLSEKDYLLKTATKVSPEFYQQVVKAINKQDAFVAHATPFEERICWYIYCDPEGKFSSRPIIAGEHPGSLAQKNGLNTGDVLQSVHGIDLKSTNSRNLFVRLLNLWPKTEEMELVVLRSKWNSNSLGYPNVRDIENKITLSFQVAEETGEE